MKVCHLATTCPGCSLWGVAYNEQLAQKTKRLEDLFAGHLNDIQIKTHSAGEHSMRERFDFIIKGKEIGLIDKERNFIPINECLQLTPKLQQAFDLLTQVDFNIRIGTIRLRASSRGQVQKFGLWLDFANNDIKNLLLEKNILKKLSENFFIEIGQKKKCLDQSTFDKEQIKLAEPKMQPWFHTHNYKTNTPIDLNCAVSSFTQPAAVTAKLMTDIIADWMQGQAQNVWEFGCGIGQYTFSLLSLGHKVSVFENDEFALACVKETAVRYQLLEKLTVHAGDFQRPQNTDASQKPDVVLVNPPKSGLKSFTQNVIAANPKKIIYVSCYPESLRADSEIFLKHNYIIKNAHVVDQFPQTNHFEVVMLFERVDI
jgi:23S rRNA (uracil1939-C5)-methyltransferase